MFTFADTPIKFVGLLVLFAFCTVWCGYELTRPQDAKQRISNAFHLVMAVVMVLMVAPATWKGLTAVVPLPVLVGGFAAFTAWFVWLSVAAWAGADRRGGLHYLGHGAMFGAMTWHLAAMATMQAAMSHGMGMGRGGMDKTRMMAEQSSPGGTLWVVALIGIPFMTYLLVSSLRSLWQAFQPPAPAAAAVDDAACEHCAVGEDQVVPASAGAAAVGVAVAPRVMTHSCHEVRPVGSVKFRLEVLAAFAMNFGMFWMSTGLMVAILPFFSVFAF